MSSGWTPIAGAEAPGVVDRMKDAIWTGVERGRGPVLRLGVAAVASALCAAPLAAEQAVAHAQIEDNIAGFPALISYTHTGQSQLDAGIMGRAYLPVTGPLHIGLSAEIKDLPFRGHVSPYSLLSSGYIAQLAGLYHEPEKAASGLEEALAVNRNELFLHHYWPLDSGLLAAGIVAGSLMLTRERRQKIREYRLDGKAVGKMAALAGVAALAVTPTVYAQQSFEHWQGSDPPLNTDQYQLHTLGGTALQDLTVSNRGLQFAVDNGADKVTQLLAAQKKRKDTFIARAEAQLDKEAARIHAPGPNETAVLVGSDMHDSEAMTTIATRLVQLYNEQFGEDSLTLMYTAGDLGYGEALEARYIDAQRHIAPDVVVSPGNHDTDVAMQEMDDSGMVRIKDKPVTVDGITIAGGTDPNVTPFSSPTELRNPKLKGTDAEASFGQKLYDQASSSKTRVNIVGPHEGYAAGAFMGLSDVTKSSLGAWFAQRGSTTVPWEDGVRDLPTSLLVYGHWHRIIAPRVVWNDDGSWTLVMELNTMGGAIGTPTITHFSTPNDAPGQTASFPIVYFDKTSGLVTGYQMFSFDAKGSAPVSDFVPIGDGDLQPEQSEVTAKPKRDHADHPSAARRVH